MSQVSNQSDFFMLLRQVCLSFQKLHVIAGLPTMALKWPHTGSQEPFSALEGACVGGGHEHAYVSECIYADAHACEIK